MTLLARTGAATLAAALAAAGIANAQGDAPKFDDRAGGASEWGFRPREGAALDAPVRAFCWRPQKGATVYRVQVAADESFAAPVAQRDVTLPVWCRPQLPDGGALFWRVAWSRDGARWSQWSRARSFTIAAGAGDGADGARAFDRDRVLANVPDAHPRLFLRPEDLPRLRALADGDLGANTAALVARCERLLRSPPDTSEPPKYPKGTVRGSDPWREIWWGNRKRTIAVLDNAATLAFTWRVTDRDDFAELAERLLLAAAAWDPKGATGYRYNDEAGMPYAYHFARTYTLLHERLDDDERRRCRDVLRARGDEMYRHLCPTHLWQPFNSHRNRAWHFLGEVAVALHGEAPEADEWLWFAVNVFGSCYPVWCGAEADGGWHEGMAYWHSYLDRFTWWADVMKAATGIDAYAQSPFFARVGDWPLYLMPPGTSGGGFGDLTAARTSRHVARLTGLFARQARNGVWQWYADRHGEHAEADRSQWISFVRDAGEAAAPVPPTALPTSRHFVGVGQVAMNTTLLDAKDNVEVIFKASPLGTQSHGYEAQNSFLLYAYGERLLIRSGKRDSYGSRHHRDWMWSTRSTNCITLDGDGGQHKRSVKAVAEVVAFETSDWCDWVDGEAGAAYVDDVTSFRRGVLFVKPHAVIVFDRVRAASEHTYDFRLHARAPFELGEQRASVAVGAAGCRVDWVAPRGLAIAQTDRFDPPPRPRVKLVEHHLTASTTTPATAATFVTVIRPFRKGEEPIAFEVVASQGDDVHELVLRAPDGPVRVRLEASGRVDVRGPGGRRFSVDSMR